MPKSHLMQKLEGETPLQALERFRVDARIGKDISMTYAGRLDPMASGALLVLIGDECKKKDAYLELDKEYEFEVLFGVTSDTGDILGMVEKGEGVAPSAQDIQKSVEALIGEHELPYPVFSSKKVEGRHLFEHALQGTLFRIEIPARQMAIRHIEVLDMRHVTAKKLLKDTSARLGAFNPPISERLGHDFRKKDIKKRWREVFEIDASFLIARFRAKVSAGTYIRALAPLIANRCGTTGLAYAITRTRIGNIAQDQVVV